MGNPFRWWWRYKVQRPWSRWTTLFGAMACTALGVGYLTKGGDAVAGYMWIGGGALWLCLCVAAWAYRRGHPVPKERWHDNLYG